MAWRSVDADDSIHALPSQEPCIRRRGSCRTASAVRAAAAPMRVRTLLLLFLAAILSDSSEAQCTATNCTALPAAYPGAGNGSVFALAYAQYQVQTALNGRALKVGAFNIAPSYAPTQRGLDGFVQFNASSNLTVVTSAPYGSAVEVGPHDLVGAVPQLFSQAGSSNNLSISWYVIRLPTSLEVGDQTKQTLWALSTLGMDVVLNPISMSPGRLAYVNLMPLQNFGYQLVVPRPVAQPISQLDKWFLWTKPFSGRLWGIICASVFGGGMLMLLFDAGQGSESLDKENLGIPLETVGHSLYLSAMGQLLHESHDPASSSGRAYLLGNALSNFLLVAIYIATLTAWLSAGPRFSVPPATINDVVTQQLPLCIRNLTAQITWMSVYYPTLPSSLYVLTGTSSDSVLEGVNAGSCAAGLSTSTDLATFLSPLEDPTGRYLLQLEDQWPDPAGRRLLRHCLREHPAISAAILDVFPANQWWQLHQHIRSRIYAARERADTVRCTGCC